MSGGGFSGEEEVETGAGREIGPVADGATVQTRDRVAYRQAHAGAALLGGKEWIEQVPNSFPSDTWPIIDHRQLNIVLRRYRGTNHEPAGHARPRRQRLQTVAHEIEDGMLYLPG